MRRALAKRSGASPIYQALEALGSSGLRLRRRPPPPARRYLDPSGSSGVDDSMVTAVAEANSRCGADPLLAQSDDCSQGQFTQFRRSLPHRHRRVLLAGADRSGRPIYMGGVVEIGGDAAQSIISATELSLIGILFGTAGQVWW